MFWSVPSSYDKNDLRHNYAKQYLTFDLKPTHLKDRLNNELCNMMFIFGILKTLSVLSVLILWINSAWQSFRFSVFHSLNGFYILTARTRQPVSKTSTWLLSLKCVFAFDGCVRKHFHLPLLLSSVCLGSWLQLSSSVDLKWSITLNKRRFKEVL